MIPARGARRFATIFASTFGARLLATAFGIVSGILIARALGPYGKGAFAASQLFVTIAVTLLSGVGAASTYLLTKRGIRAGALMLPLAILLAAATLAGAVIGIAAMAVSGVSPIVVAAIVVLPTSIAVSWQPAYYSALGKFAALNAQAVMLPLLVLVGVALALTLHAGLPGVLVAWVAATALIAGAFSLHAVRVAGGVQRDSVRSLLREVSTFGLQSSGNAMLGLLNYRIDSMLIGAMLGLSAFGIYSVAVNVGEMLFLVSRTVTTVLTRDIGSLDAAASARICARAIRTVTAVLGGVALLAWFVLPPAIGLVYGHRFDSAVLPLRVLLPGIVACSTVGTFCAYFLFQVGRPSIVTWLNALTIGVQAMLCVLLIPRFGMVGAAFASSVTYVVGALYCTHQFCRLGGLAPSELWIPRTSDFAGLRGALGRSAAPNVSVCAKPMVLVTGAAGRIATLVRPLLRERYQLRLTDRLPIADLHEGETFVQADLMNASALRRAARGVDAIVHLGGAPAQADFREHVRGTIEGTYNVFDAARDARVRRLVFASTGHVTGFYRKTDRIGVDARSRPDGVYAAAKSFGEALASAYADTYGLRVLVVRIGHCSAAPHGELDRSIWISPADLVQIICIGIQHPDVANHVVYGMSKNKRSWWTSSELDAFGYEPRDSADMAAPSAADRAGIAGHCQGDTFARRREL